jgi:hypothetical protein
MTALPFRAGCVRLRVRHRIAGARRGYRGSRGRDVPRGRPGGRIVIIDKNREQWGRLEDAALGKVVGPERNGKLLARHCRRVSSRPISYWEDVAPDGLFLAWLAER